MECKDSIKALGEKIGLDLELDSASSCTFQTDGFSVTITHLVEIDRIALTGDLGDVPPQRPENLFRLMLEANYLFSATAGATLSLNGDNQHFALCRVITPSLQNENWLYSEVEEFVSICEKWLEIITNFRDLPTSTDDTDSSQSHDFSSLLSV